MLSTSKSFFRKAGGGATPTTDASFAYVPLLTETGSVSVAATTVADGAQTPNTVTRNGTLSTGWTSPYQTDGYWSNYFPGSSSLTATDNAVFGFGNGDFTVECWIYLTTLGTQGIWSNGNSATGTFGFYINSTNKLEAAYYGGAAVAGATSLTTGTWYHVAVSRSGGTVTRVFLNGVQDATNTSSFNNTSTKCSVGVPFSDNTSYLSNGYISNLRVVKGVAVYTSAFTPSTAPLTATQSANVNGNPSAAITGTQTSLLTCQSNRFKDNGTANSGVGFPITVNGTPSVQSGYYPFAAPTASPGAALFNGSAQYLRSTTATTAFQFGTNPFTIEFWTYQTSRPARQYLCGGVFSGPGFQMVIDSPGVLYSGVTGIGNLPSATIAVPLNAWTHIAIVRTSTSASGAAYYVNGAPAGTLTISSDISGTASSINVGTSGDSSSEPTNGYIGNFRAVKGTAVYTGAFTPPSGPLTQTGGTYPSTTNVVTGFSAANTSLLLALSDSNYTSASNGGTNNTFIDDSTNAFTITRNGTPTQGSRTPYWPNGQWSNYFSGSSTYLNIGTQSILNVGTGNFTVECFIFFPGRSTTWSREHILAATEATGGSGVTFAINGSTQGSTGISASIAGTTISSTTAISANTWHHVAAVRSSGVVTIYVDGVSKASGTAAGSISNTASYNIGSLQTTDPQYADYFQGYISNLRTTSTAVYSGSTITVPTSPLSPSTTNQTLLTCYSNRFVDANTATTAKTITVAGSPSVQAFQPFSPAASYSAATYAGSGYFPSSGSSYLSSTITALSNTFVVMECWLYNNSLDNTQGNHFLQVGPNPTYLLSHNGNGQARFLSRNDSTGDIFDIISATGILKLNQWQYVVGVRNATTASLYVDGARVGTLTVSTSSTSATAFYASGNAGTTRLLDGYMANARIISGPLPSGYDPTSTTIAVPTTPLTNVAGTRVLLNFANAGIYDAAAQNDMITVGDAQVSTTQSKWSPSSMKFDGTGDWLLLPNNPAFAFGTGDFTLECWVYFTSVAGAPTITDSRSSTSSTAGFNLGLSSAKVQLYTTSQLLIGGTTLAINQWYYIAVTRAGTALKIFVNGSQDATTSNSTNWSDQTLVIGATPSLVNPMTGYIQDLRLTKGVARTITTPTAAFPTR